MCDYCAAERCYMENISCPCECHEQEIVILPMGHRS